ncbi:ATPase PAAT [Talpa occidentalis]|uniref:ATPase PAAT n=1 Tax=Talpa occidentalis TaxID=50954 RepID=UPI00188FE72F|nr:ATPase PAAT [Talpa occidentalis]
MESGAGDEPPTLRPTLGSSWAAAGAGLAPCLQLHRAGRGAADADWEELLAPPAPGRGAAVLTRGPRGPGAGPCCLFLRCDPRAGAEVAALGVLSSARIMEVYAGDEYCGTGRGEAARAGLESSEHEKIILYRKYLILESSTPDCKIKLLSFGDKQCVFVSKVVVHIRPVSVNPSPSFPALGSRIDLERVQTIMESMGSKLSPGAQQLMHMVRFQQQNRLPIGEQLQSVLGNAGCKHVIEASPSALDTSSSTPFPFRTGLTSGSLTEDFKACLGGSTQPPGGGPRAPDLGERTVVPPRHSLLENDLQHAVSSLLPKKASDDSNVPSSDLLPFLQNLCSQVNHLRVGRDTPWQEALTKPREGVAAVPTEEKPLCSYLENILSKNMELMEKKLTGYIDQRLCRLQEHLDNKIALLVDLVQNPGSPHSELPLRHCDSGERLSNGER